nr:hypothetical protein CFP56_22332 [Quercus suber]
MYRSCTRSVEVSVYEFLLLRAPFDLSCGQTSPVVGRHSIISAGFIAKCDQDNEWKVNRLTSRKFLRLFVCLLQSSYRRPLPHHICDVIGYHAHVELVFAILCVRDKNDTKQLKTLPIFHQQLTMEFLLNALLVSTLTILTAAQSTVLTFTSVPNHITKGLSQTLRYSTNDTNHLITIVLRKGVSSDLQTIQTLTTAAPANGTYLWTPSAALADGSDYALEIVQGMQTNYFGPFAISGPAVSTVNATVTVSALPTSPVGKNATVSITSLVTTSGAASSGVVVTTVLTAGVTGKSTLSNSLAVASTPASASGAGFPSASASANATNAATVAAFLAGRCLIVGLGVAAGFFCLM